MGVSWGDLGEMPATGRRWFPRRRGSIVTGGAAGRGTWMMRGVAVTWFAALLVGFDRSKPLTVAVCAAMTAVAWWASNPARDREWMADGSDVAVASRGGEGTAPALDVGGASTAAERCPCEGVLSGSAPGTGQWPEPMHVSAAAPVPRVRHQPIPPRPAGLSGST